MPEVVRGECLLHTGIGELEAVGELDAGVEEEALDGWVA